MNTELVSSTKIAQKSYSRCLVGGKLIDRFYEIFLATSSKIKERFTNTDFDKQKHLLRHGINLMIMYAEGNVVGKSGIDRIRKTHNRHQMNISPEYYSLWKLSLIKAISEIDYEFNAEVEQAWNKTLDVGIEYIKSGY